MNSERYDLLLLLANLVQKSTANVAQQSEALALLDRAAGLRPPSRSFYQIRSRCRQTLGQTAEADHDDALAAGVTQLTAQDWFLAGEMERSASAIEPAIADYQRALRIDPEHYWAQFQLARCYVQTQRGPEAVALLGTCIALRPDAPWAYSTRGLVHGLLGQFEASEADLKQSLRIAPQFRPAHLNRGFVYFLQNSFEAAVSELDAVLLPPSESVLIEAAYYRAQIHYQRGDLVNALRDCEMFLRDRPDFAPAHTLAAQIHFRMGDDSQGIHSVDAALACGQSPSSQLQDGQAGLNRGNALRELATGLDLATQQRVLRLALKEFESIGGSSVDTEMTSIQDLLGLSGEVIDAYSERLAAVPSDRETRKKRAWNYATLQQLDLALADFETTLQQAADDAEAHIGLGYVLALKGDRDRAEQEATQAILYGADDFLMLHYVAYVYGELAEANPQQRNHYQDLAIMMLEQAVSLARKSQSGINEIELIRNDPTFHDHLRAREEFQNLLGVPTKP